MSAQIENLRTHGESILTCPAVPDFSLTATGVLRMQLSSRAARHAYFKENIPAKTFLSPMFLSPLRAVSSFWLTKSQDPFAEAEETAGEQSSRSQANYIHIRIQRKFNRVLLLKPSFSALQVLLTVGPHRA